MTGTVRRGYVGLTLGKEVFADLYFPDDVAILSEMLEILILALEIIHEESSALDLEINWTKTQIHASCGMNSVPSTVCILNNQVDIVDFFVYVGSCVNSSGGNNQEEQPA